jgi:hypothetical protein
MLIRLISQENAQLTTGTGVVPNLLGLATNASVLTVGSAGTDLDAIASAFAAIRTRAAHCDPDVVVQHPTTGTPRGHCSPRRPPGPTWWGPR